MLPFLSIWSPCLTLLYSLYLRCILFFSSIFWFSFVYYFFVFHSPESISVSFFLFLFIPYLHFTASYSPSNTLIRLLQYLLHFPFPFFLTRLQHKYIFFPEIANPFFRTWPVQFQTFFESLIPSIFSLSMVTRRPIIMDTVYIFVNSQQFPRINPPPPKKKNHKQIQKAFKQM